MDRIMKESVKQKVKLKRMWKSVAEKILRATGDIALNKNFKTYKYCNKKF